MNERPNHRVKQADWPHESREEPVRRPYQKPQVLCMEPLEAVAADCSIPGGKGDPTCVVGFS